MKGIATWSSLWCLALLGASVSNSSSAYADNAITLDPGLKAYVKVSGVSGTVNSIGSDTLNNLMTLWAEGFRKQYPNVKIQIEGMGSSTAPPALIEGTSQLGPMSRLMKNTETDAFERKFRYKPTAFPVAIDALAVYVNKDNPVKGLTMAQVDAIFSKSRRWGHNENIQFWKQTGLNDDFGNSPISIYGRNSASGTYGFFKEHALKNGDFKDEVKEQPGSASVVQSVSEDQAGLGTAALGTSHRTYAPFRWRGKTACRIKRPANKTRTTGHIRFGAISTSM